MDYRNGYMLAGSLARRGYDWWWHSLVGVHKQTGEKQSFFIEYYVINPALSGWDAPVLGQAPENKKNGIKPSYAMMNCGRWGARKAQLHEYYPIKDFSANVDRMDVRIGTNTATETHIKGSIKVTPEMAARPEMLSDAGEMEWDLKVEKILQYNVGYGASAFFRKINAFNMFWHVQGMRTYYTGTIIFNGEEYAVEPETCAGYQDKNWGIDYTSPWVWLNCNNFKSRSSGKTLLKTSLDVGGAQPVMFGVSLPRRLLIAFYYEGELFEFNFSKFWTNPNQKFDCPVTDEKVAWDITAWNNKGKIEIHFTCPRESMINVNYENPDGMKRHNQLWNGGYTAGSVTLYRKVNGAYELVDTFDGELGGGEYGEYDQ